MQFISEKTHIILGRKTGKAHIFSVLCKIGLKYRFIFQQNQIIANNMTLSKI